jgi:hypothetical protein
MKIGIISDTHNNLGLVRKAIEVFKSKNVDLVVHAGDLTSPKVLELFGQFKCRFVLGNGDIDVEAINVKSGELGFGGVCEYCELEADGKKIFVFHGNDVPLFRQIVASGEYHYIIKGHTHFFENYISNSTRVINPGTLYGSEEYTVAVLDTALDKVEKIRIMEE